MVNLADQIAYNNHDIDDGLRAGLIDLEQLNEIDLFSEQFDEVSRHYPQLNSRRRIHEIVRRMINCQVVDLIETSQQALKELAPRHIDDVRQQASPIMAFSDQMRERNQQLKRFLRKNLYHHYRVHRMSAKAGRIINALFNAFMDDMHLLPPEYVENAKSDSDSDDTRARVIADYMAGMTDRYAIREYRRIFEAEELT